MVRRPAPLEASSRHGVAGRPCEFRDVNGRSSAFGDDRDELVGTRCDQRRDVGGVGVLETLEGRIRRDHLVAGEQPAGVALERGDAVRSWS